MIDALDGFATGEREAWVLCHLGCDSNRRLGAATANPGLQDVKAARGNGELDIAHVPVMVLQPVTNLHQFLVNGREARG